MRVLKSETAISAEITETETEKCARQKKGKGHSSQNENTMDEKARDVQMAGTEQYRSGTGYSKLEQTFVSDLHSANGLIQATQGLCI